MARPSQVVLNHEGVRCTNMKMKRAEEVVGRSDVFPLFQENKRSG